jgi:uncharacterized membrane-anchored protein
VKPQPKSVLQQAVSKVPLVTAAFWVTKVLTTGMGESASDFLSYQLLGPLVALAVCFAGLVAGLVLQFRARRYVPWIYWFAVSMVAVFGTIAADIVHEALGISLLTSTAFFAVVMVVLFAVWYATEKTLSFHSIYTRRREAFYWATVLATFALGTAAGDMTADTLNLGFLASGIMFAVAITVPLVAYKWFGLNAIAAFWIAYVLTRPLGASFADWFGMPTFMGGVGLGHALVTVVSTIAIIGLVVYLTMVERKEDLVEEVPSATYAAD